MQFNPFHKSNRNKFRRKFGHLFPVLKIERFDIEKSYDAIYKKPEAIKSGSGPGSMAKHASTYCPKLLKILHELNPQRVVDYGCGNMEIYKGHLQWNNQPFEYVGIDLSETLIRNLKKEYAGLNFHYVPAFTNSEELHGDVIIVKDVFIHWYDDQINWFVENIFPKFKYGVFVHSDILRDHDTGIEKWRSIHHEDYFQVISKQTITLDKIKNIVVAKSDDINR